METQRYEIDAFLGGDEFYTAEQRDQIADEYLAWERQGGARVTDAEAWGEDIGSVVLAAIAARVGGELDIDTLAAADRDAQRVAAKARLELRAAVIALVRPGGMTESEAERRAGVTRMTVRSWLGK